MKNIAVYGGTFDPITLGHVDLIERASHVFDEIIVAVAKSPNKQPLFSLNERVDLCAQVLSRFSTVVVEGFEGLLLEFVKKHQANILLRGLRTVTDFDYEFQLASMNRHLNPKIESIFMMPAENYMYISSSLVREVASLGGNVAGLVPDLVEKALKNKFS